MKIVFFGTPEFVVEIANSLHKTYNRGVEKEFIGVVTQPPQKSGREQILTRSAVDNWAYKHKVPVYFDPTEAPAADLAVLAAYGEILPQSVIDKYPLGILNIHPSLLPKFRGASPVQATIATGEQPGVSIIKMDHQMDHGPIISYFKDELLFDDTNESLRRRLFLRSAKFLIELLPAYLAGKIKPKVQDHDKATYTKLITKQAGFIPGYFLESALKGKANKKSWQLAFIKDLEFSPTPESLERFIRSIHPWPGAWTEVTVNNEKLRLKIITAHLEEQKLVLDQVQLEGRTEVSFDQFTQGYPDYSFK